MGIRYTQPQYPVDIDWSNPLTNGLALARNQANEYGSGLAPFVYSNGVNQRAVSATSGGVVLPPTQIGPEGTILFIAKNKVGTGTSEYFWDGETATNRDIFYTAGGTETFGWYIGGVQIADATPIGASFLDSTVPTVATLAWSNGSQQAYKNGVLHTSKAVALSVNTTRSIRLYSRYTSNEGMLTGGMALFLYFNRKLSAVEIKSLSDNPWQIFKSQSRRIWVAAAGGGDATATITGVSGSAQVGTVSTSGNASVSLPGASGAGSVGNVVASVSAATAITGVNGAGQVGNTTQTGAANVAVSTVAGTGQVGTVSASGIGAPDGNVAITGIAGTGQVGTLAASGNGAVSITGIAATGSVGSVTPSVTVTTTITGAIGTGSVGTTTQTGAANATVSSAVGIGLVGTVSATGTSQDGNAIISGISGIGSVGIVSANDGTVVNNHGFIIIDTEPRLWWKRKPSKLDDKKAEEKIFKVARVIERVVKHVANSNEPSVSKEVYRKAAYAEVAPLLREMPGFDWSPMFRAILTQSKLQEQNRIAAEQAGILAKQEIERIKRIRDDEEALIVLLMGA